MTNITYKIYCCWIVYSYLTVLVTRVMSREFSQCYNDVNICLWTDGSSLTYSEAQTACQQRNNSFLPRITNSHLQNKLQLLRGNTSLLGTWGFWIDVKNVDVDSFHWIDGSSLSGGEVRNKQDSIARYAVILYDTNNRQFVYYAKRLNYQKPSSYICQLQQGATCLTDDLSVNSKCYRKFHNEMTWFGASNDCLSHGGSLAVFTDIGRPPDNSQLTAWLNTTRSYWIGLVRYWWETRNEFDVQYTNWDTGQPSIDDARRCVVVTQYNYWIRFNCKEKQRFVCQNYIRRPETTTTAPPVTPTSPDITSIKGTFINSSTSNAANKSSDDTASAGKDLGLVIGLAVGLSVLIIVATVVIVLLLNYKKRRSTSEAAGKHTAANGHVTNGEVNATGHDTSMYATIVPAVKSDNDKDKSGNDVNPEQPTVIYSEIMAKQT